MQIKVDVNLKSEDLSTTLEMIAGPEDTVQSLKDRVADLQPLPFPQQDLLFNGEVLADDAKLGDLGIEDGSSLQYVVQATEEAFMKQLTDLLRTRELSCDELSLLYCYKHGASITQALKSIGHGGRLQDFVKKNKAFQLEGTKVSLALEEASSLKPRSVVQELVQILQATPVGAMDIKELCAKFAAKFNVSLSSLTGVKVVDFLCREPDTFIVTGRTLVSLKDFKHVPAQKAGARPRALPVKAPISPVSSTPASPIAEAQVLLAINAGTPPPGLCVAIDSEDGLAGCLHNDQLQELHNSISSRALNSKVSQLLAETVESLRNTLFLNVDRVVRGGSMGKGTATSSLPDAEVVFFLKGLPSSRHRKWLPPLLMAVAKSISEKSGGSGIRGIQITEDCIRLDVNGLLLLDLRFSPVFESNAAALQALQEQGVEARHHFVPTLVEQRVQFVARQSGTVKATIRLMKWWRDQQDWSAELTRPSDDVMELATIYAFVQSKPTDLAQGIVKTMQLLSRFNEIRVVWSNFYSKADVWPPLLQQRPLLMDPTNPFVNVADPQVFDPREMMAMARTTRFFW